MSVRPKRVTFVQTQAENAGAQEIARQLALGAARHGWDISQVFLFRRTEAFDGDANVVYCARQRPGSPFGVVRLLYCLFRELRRNRPDAVVTFQHYGNVIAAPIARLAGIRLVVANQMTAAPSIPPAVRLVDRLLGRTGVYTHIVVNSADTEAAYAAYPRSYLRRLLRIDHGVTDKSARMSKEAARAGLGVALDGVLLGCAARLHPVKQMNLAIRLLTENPAWRLAIAGQGADRLRLEALAAALGVMSRVHFLGELSTERMGVFLKSLDCFVFPSSAETFGLAPVEAALSGLPVVVNDLAIMREVLHVAGEPCALFVDASNTPAFAAAVESVLANRALADELTAIGQRLGERYPLDKMVDDYMRLLHKTPA